MGDGGWELGLHVSRLKRAVWRRSKPEGYTESRLVQGEDGAWYRDMEYEGETAWQDRPGGGGQAEALEERVPSGERPARGRGKGEEKEGIHRGQRAELGFRRHSGTGAAAVEREDGGVGCFAED